MLRAAPLVLAAMVAGTLAAQEVAVPVSSALEPASTGGIGVVDRALAKLATHRRLLVIGAHPDDEDTSLLTLVSRGLGGEAAYLSLSRGDGGQNLIGTELGEGLGLLRTQELLAARRIDGAHQFFTRAFDFGYTRSLDETLTRWPPEVLLEDVARVVWRFRPQVIVAMFSPEIGGHGQHLASGWAAQEVFEIAGDADAFPGLVAEGWQVWQPTGLYRRTWFDPERATLELDLGLIEGLSGRSMLQIAMASRSQHRSQDMGMLQPLGSRPAGLEWVAGGVGPEAEDLFAGVDTRLAALAAELPEGELRREAETVLEAVARRATVVRAELAPARLQRAVAPLAAILSDLRRLREEVISSGLAGAAVVEAFLSEKIEIAEAALVAAAEIGIDAISDRETVAPGGTAEIVASVWNAGGLDVEVTDVGIGGPRAGPGGDRSRTRAWEVEPRRIESPGALGVEEWGFAARVVESAAATMPYYLRRPRHADLYDWSEVPPETRGLPYQPPELTARFRLALGDVEVEIEREVVYRTRDQAVGEIRRPLRIVPRAEISVEPGLLVWNTRSGEPRTLRATVISHVGRRLRGEVSAQVPPGWTAEVAPFTLEGGAGEVSVELRIEPAGAPVPGRHRVELVARLAEGGEERLALPLLDFPHVRPAPLPVAARAEISAFDLALPDVGRFGYVRGASDRLPELLEQVGLDVELLAAADLARGDLSRFEVIVVGSRAYETDAALVDANARLLDFVRSGGRLIVQYQQYQFSRGGYAPYAFEIGRPHGRITDEAAAVELLEPSHPVFHTPNELTAADWEGWVQERGLYFPESWGEELTPLLSMTDPEMEAETGGLLVGRLGDGLWVYTGLAFFRQLPAGVAGGFRLFANLLALEVGE